MSIARPGSRPAGVRTPLSTRLTISGRGGAVPRCKSDCLYVPNGISAESEPPGWSEQLKRCMIRLDELRRLEILGVRRTAAQGASGRRQQAEHHTLHPSRGRGEHDRIAVLGRRHREPERVRQPALVNLAVLREPPEGGEYLGEALSWGKPLRSRAPPRTRCATYREVLPVAHPPVHVQLRFDRLNPVLPAPQGRVERAASTSISWAPDSVQPANQRPVRRRSVARC